MSKFKMNQMIASSLVALVIGGTPLYSMDNGPSLVDITEGVHALPPQLTPLPNPSGRTGGQAAYQEMKRRYQQENDYLAHQIMNKFGDFSGNAGTAAQAVVLYNQVLAANRKAASGGGGGQPSGGTENYEESELVNTPRDRISRADTTGLYSKLKKLSQAGDKDAQDALVGVPENFGANVSIARNTLEKFQSRKTLTSRKPREGSSQQSSRTSGGGGGITDSMMKAMENVLKKQMTSELSKIYKETYKQYQAAKGQRNDIADPIQKTDGWDKDKFTNEINALIQEIAKMVGAEKAQAGFAEATGMPMPQTGAGMPGAEQAVYEEKIRALEAELRKARMSGGSAEPSNDKVKEVYAQLREMLKGDKIKYRGDGGVQELLKDLLQEDDSDKAISGFINIIQEARASEKDPEKSDKLTGIYGNFGEEGTLKQYFKGLKQKEISEQKKIFGDAAKLTKAKLPVIPDKDMLTRYPLLILLYIDKDKAVGIWDKDNMPKLDPWVKSTPIDLLQVIYMHLVEKWKTAHKSDAATMSLREQLLINIYDTILANKKPEEYKQSKEDSLYINSKLKNDMPLPYDSIMATALNEYKKQYDSIKTSLEKEIAAVPLLKFLMINEIEDWGKADFGRAGFDKVVDLLKYLTLPQLQALMYHFSQLKVVNSDAEGSRYIFGKVYEELTAREAEFKNSGNDKVTPLNTIVKGEMSIAVKTIGAQPKKAVPEKQKPIPEDEKMKRGGPPQASEAEAKMLNKIKDLFGKPALWPVLLAKKFVKEGKNPDTLTLEELKAGLEEMNPKAYAKDFPKK